MHVSKKIALLALFVCTAFTLSGCGGSSKPISISITSSSSTVDGSDSVTLTVTVANDKNSAGVSWAITSGGGTLSSQTTTSATYTAPAATGSQQTVTITATSVAKNTQTGTVTITVPAAPAVTTTSANLTGAVGSAFSVKLAASGGIPPFTWALGSGTTLPACLTLKSDGTLTTANGMAPSASCAGSYTNLTFKATDSGVPNPLSVTSAPMTVTITAPNLSFTPMLPGGNVGVAYVGSVAASGVVGASTYSIASGALPADLSLNASTGAITGTPKASDVGTANFSVSVTDAYGDAATSGNMSIAIAAAPAITFTGSVPATGTYNVAFSGSAAASGGAGALTYSISAGALPADLSLNASTGAISGNPSKVADVGVFNFTVQAADAYGDSATQSYTLTVSYAAMNITASTLPTGYVNGLYPNQTLAATGGTGVATNYSWQVSGGALPGGLSLSTAGVISGTISNTTTTGAYNFTVKVTDTVANISGTANFSITVDAGVSITTSSLPTGYVGSAYTSTTLQASGGTGTGYQWIVTGGTNLPSGLTLSLGGVLSGTPANPGTTSVTFQVADSVGNTATASLSITVDAGVSVTAPVLNSAYPGTAYTSAAFSASGGTNTGFTWSWAAASGSTLPNGLSINSSTGIISGTPVNAGTSSVTSSVVVTATDSVGNKGSATVSITIEATLTITTSTTLPSGTAGVAYSQALAASGGSGTGYSWSTDSAGTTSLAGVGLALAVNGTITGATPTLGTATFTATVKDTENHTTNATFTVTINNQLKISPTTLPAGDQGSAYSQTLTASGGSGSGYTFTATSSNLSNFSLTLGTDGSITGTPSQSGTASFTANVKDSANNTATQAYTITINGALTLPNPNPASLPGGYVGVSYTGDVAASGGSGNYCYSVLSGLPADGLSAPANNSLCGYVAPSFLVSGTPTAAATVTFTLKVTDGTGASIIKIYTIDVTTPTAPSLPTPSTSVPGSATNGQSYTASIVASGGVGPTYTWTVNGSTTLGALGASGLASQFSVSSSGSSTLAITGNPTATGSVTFTAQVKDNTTGLTSSTQTYTIQVNSAGSNVSGQIYLSTNCGTVTSNLPSFSVQIVNSGGTTFTQTVNTDSSGNFNFTGVPNGTYIITPSISGPSSAFYPSAMTVTVNNGDLSGQNFAASLGYTVSGTVNYGGSTTGQIYVDLVGNCANTVGTSISSKGSFTIHGVSPGSYTLYAWMDPSTLGEGHQNTSDPTGSTSGITLTAADLTGQSVTLQDPTSLSVGTSGPNLKAGSPIDQGIVISYGKGSISDNNGVEMYTSYTVQWATSTSGFSSSQQAVFKAVGTDANVWILHNGMSGMTGTLSNGTAYYFQVKGSNAAGSSPWTVSPSAITIGAPSLKSGEHTVTGTITIPSSVTINSGAVLYAGLYDQSTNTAYGQVFTNPSNSTGNNFTVYVPSGTSYVLFGILDQNKDGLIDAGDVTNVNSNGSNTIVSVSGDLSGQNVTLPATDVSSTVSTQYSQYTTAGGTSSNYGLSILLSPSNKLPVSVELTSGPGVIAPIDLGNYCTGCGGIYYQYQVNNVATPTVGDTYTFTVKYSDGSSDSNVTAKVTAFGSTGAIVGPGDLATNLSPSAMSSASLTPTFTWTDPSNASNYTYQFQIQNASGSCSGNCTIWQIPSQNGNSSGFDSSITSITWGTDPTDGSNTPTVTSLSNGVTYNWSITVQDSNSNTAQNWTYYVP